MRVHTMKIDPKAAASLASGGGDAITNGLARLTTVRSVKSAMGGGGGAAPAEQESEDDGEAESGGDAGADAILKLGASAATLMLYAEEVEAAIDADKLLKKLDADVEPTEEIIEAIEAAYAELPGVVQGAIDDLDVDIATMTAAGEAMVEKKLAKDAARWAVFLFLSHALSTQHSGDMTDEDESPEEDEAEIAAAQDAMGGGM